jgi:hypothetical protein
MAIHDAFLPDFDHEMGTTEERSNAYRKSTPIGKPHDMSMSMGRLV